MTWLPFELHPEIPEAGTTAEELFGPRFDAETRRRYRSRLEALAAEAGLPYDPPGLIPNTHLSLEAAEWVRRSEPEAFGPYHRALFDAYFARGRDIGDADVLLEEAAMCGIPLPELGAALQSRSMGKAVDRCTRDAIELGVSGTPGWLIDGALLVPGCQPRDTFDRIIGRMRDRASEA